MASRKHKHQQQQTSPEPCDVAGCTASGEYKAPKHRHGAREYYHFCIDHIREFNKRYNFFDGMADDDVQAFMKDAVTGHRPTWRLGQGPDITTLDLEQRLRAMFDHAPAPYGLPLVPAKVRDALELLDLQHPTDTSSIKQHYKQLAKIYHPDVNKSEDATEKFREITDAYHTLIEHYRLI
jgi:hypothetical protein